MRLSAADVFGLLALPGVAACSGQESRPSAAAEGGADAIQLSLATSALVGGFPLVVTQRTFQTFAGLIGNNVLYNQSSLSDASGRLVVSPNVDTLYSVAVVDLCAEPMVLTVPEVTDRYWTYQFLDVDGLVCVHRHAHYGRHGRHVCHHAAGVEGHGPCGRAGHRFSHADRLPARSLPIAWGANVPPRRCTPSRRAIPTAGRTRARTRTLSTSAACHRSRAFGRGRCTVLTIVFRRQLD